jgi:glutathione peroxidase
MGPRPKVLRPIRAPWAAHCRGSKSRQRPMGESIPRPFMNHLFLRPTQMKNRLRLIDTLLMMGAFLFASVSLAQNAATPSPSVGALTSNTMATSAASSVAPSPCPGVLNYRVLRLQDEKSQDLCQYAGQVVLVVNTASFCGFTPQYKGLEALYDHYKSRGFVVLGFPSNDFSQEPKANADIADFCESTYGVKFPMFTKTSVKGDSASPLFKVLAQRTHTTPKWNFYKYLISRDGQKIQSYSSMTDPQDKEFLTQLETALNARVN